MAYQTTPPIKSNNTQEHDVPTQDENNLLSLKSSDRNLLPKKSQQRKGVDKQMSDGNQSYTSSQYSNNSKLRLEHELYDIPRDKTMRLFHFLFLFLIIAAAALLLFFQNQNANVMRTVAQNVEILGASVKRLQRIINNYGLCVALILLSTHKNYDNRYASIGLPSYTAASFLSIKGMAVELLDTNAKIRNMLYRMDAGLTESLNEEFDVVDFNENGEALIIRKLNSFDLVTEIGARLLRIVKNKATSPTDTDIRFVVRNAINDVLVHCETGINVITSDTQLKLQELDTHFVLITCLLAAFGFLLLILFLFRLKMFFADREKIINIFQRLSEKEIIQHSVTVDRFCLLLMKYDMDIKRISLRMNKEELIPESSRQKESQIQRSKEADMRGTNLPIMKSLLGILMLLVIIFSGYIVTTTIVNQQNATIKRKINLAVTSNSHFYELYMLWAVISQYIGESTNITIRNNPASEEYDRVLSTNLANMDADFLSVIDKENGLGEDPLLVELFTGNLCKVAVSAMAAALGNPCNKLLGGLASKGIIGIESYYKYKMQQMKSSYDNSAQTLADQVSLLNSADFIQAQGIAPGYLFTACDNANTQMQKQLSKDASKFTERVRIPVIVYLIIYLIVVIPAWVLVRKAFLKERARWRKLFRLIPYSQVESNKMLKGYFSMSSSE